MYTHSRSGNQHQHDFGTPTPHIQRRPFSPDEYESYAYAQTSNFLPQALQPGVQAGLRRREPSDSSAEVDALDLADYAATLRRGDHEDRYAAALPQLPDQWRGRGVPESLREPPSLYVGTSTAPSSSVGTGRAIRGFPPSSYGGSRYPPSSAAFLPAAHLSPIHDTDSEMDGYLATPHAHAYPDLDDEPDVSKFPSWSRNWFEPNSKKHPPPNPRFGEPFPELDLASNSGALPWQNRATDAPTLTQSTREERLRMLQREFGTPDGAEQRLKSDNAIGGVDEKGRLITGGRRKRIGLRVVQSMLVIIGGGSSIYGALFIKVPPPSIPPPAHHLATYALYILSVITLLLQFYLFAIRPCCGGNRKAEEEDPYTGMPGGMMVLPMQGSVRGNGKKSKGKKGKGKNTQGQGGDVHVNLIVDPRMFNRQDEVDEDTLDTESNYPTTTASHPTGRPRPHRRPLFRGMQLERQWLHARWELKKLLFVDCVFLVLWSTEFVLILMAPKCPIGGFEGWCTAYNLATACACFLIIAYGTSVFFGVRDLAGSKVSPRTRT